MTFFSHSNHRYKEKENRLDILINNAGVMRCPYSLTKDGIEMQLGGNLFIKWPKQLGKP